MRTYIESLIAKAVIAAEAVIDIVSEGIGQKRYAVKNSFYSQLTGVTDYYEYI